MSNRNLKEPFYYNGLQYDSHHKDYNPDLQFFIFMAQKHGSPILELACGTGRLTIPIARLGLEITGIDISFNMLVRANEKANKENLIIEWVHGDMRHFNFKKKFKLIFIAFNAIAYLYDVESISSCFGQVRDHLADDGRFIIDYFNPDFNILKRSSDKRYPVTEYIDPITNKLITINETNTYDDALQINRIKWFYHFNNESEDLVENLDMRIFFPQELESYLYYNGFDVESKYGNYNFTPFNIKSGRQIIVAMKKE